MKRLTWLNTISFMLVCLFQSAAADPEFESMLDGLLDGTVPQISTEALAAYIENFVLLDSRSRDEYETSHLQGAQWVGFRKFDLEDLEELDRDTTIVVYCSVGKRSELVGAKLQKAGFENVKNLRGGIFQWANENRPVVDKNGSTGDVHPYDRKWGRWLAPHVSKKK
jgi:rhodanese-related sulfurtransferase